MSGILFYSVSNGGGNVSEDDIKSIVHIEKECFSAPWSERAIRSCFDSDATPWNFFIAKSDIGCVGYGGIYTVCDCAYVTNIAVIREYRRKGIASKILENMITYCKESGIKSLMLEVRVSNSVAIALYKKYGFSTAGISKNHYSLPREDAYNMCLTIE